MSAETPPREERLKWFLDARFGMFVHWGCYSVLGRGEQIMSRDVIPLNEYEPIADEFQPADDWAPRLAQTAADAGANYMVLTTRHHDGYCLFETETHDFTAPDTGPGRDLVREYVVACREAGLKVGFYYSVMNWRWPALWDAEGHPEDLPKMVEEVHTQVRELMTNYGKIDILWYDVSAPPGRRTPGRWKGTSDYNAGEFYRSEELNRWVRKTQPHILLNNRSGVEGDFSTPEQSTRAQEGAWETCMTLNPAPCWGYLRHCSVNKTPAEVLYYLMDAVRQGGNFLFNVGPRPSGYVDMREAKVLHEISRWLDRHGEAVYGTRPEGIYRAGDPQGPMYCSGMWTCRGAQAYFTIFRYPGPELVVSKVGPRIKSAELLTTGQQLELEPMSNSRTKLKGLPADPPNPLAPVLKIEFEAPPYAIETTGAEWLWGEFGEE
jgi:alpha-L-fucosidase